MRITRRTHWTRLGQIAAVLAAVALGACNPFARKHHVAEIDPGDVAATNRWHGTLTTPPDMAGALNIKGTTTMGPASNANSTIVHISITNAPPGGTHPWHVHKGRCGDNGDIVGSASAYPLLKVDGDGTASATTTLSVRPPTDGDYYVAVDASPTNLQSVIACGNLAPPAAQ